MSAEIASAIARLDEKISQVLELPATEPEWLSVNGAAYVSGLSSDSVRKMISDGIITAYRPVSGRVLVNRNEFNLAIRAATHVPENRRGTKRKRNGGGQ